MWVAVRCVPCIAWHSIEQGQVCDRRVSRSGTSNPGRRYKHSRTSGCMQCELQVHPAMRRAHAGSCAVLARLGRDACLRLMCLELDSFFPYFWLSISPSLSLSVFRFARLRNVAAMLAHQLAGTNLAPKWYFGPCPREALLAGPGRYLSRWAVRTSRTSHRGVCFDGLTP